MPSRNQFSSNEKYNKWYQEYREKNREKIREYNREYNRIFRLKNGYGCEEKWGKNNNHKVRAKLVAYYWFKKGIIKRKGCEVISCGKKAVMHHNDYKKKKDIIWLCPKHHKRTHLLFNEKTLKRIGIQKLLKILQEVDKLKK